MKLKRIIYIGICIVIVIIAANVFRIDKYDHRRIYNNNSKIAKVEDACNILSISGNFRNNNYSVDVKDVIGKTTILIVDASEKSNCEIEYESFIEKGKLKAVFVSEDKKVTNIFEQSKNGKCTLEVPKGKGVIKLVGDSAYGKVKMKFNTNSNVKVYTNRG